MTQALMLLAVVAVGAGLAAYGRIQGRRERQTKPHADPRQQALFPPQDNKPTDDHELVMGC